VVGITTDIGMRDASPEPPGAPHGSRVGIDRDAKQGCCLLAIHAALPFACGLCRIMPQPDALGL
jgi:hypothetical protein